MHRGKGKATATGITEVSRSLLGTGGDDAAVKIAEMYMNVLTNSEGRQHHVDSCDVKPSKFSRAGYGGI